MLKHLGAIFDKVAMARNMEGIFTLFFSLFLPHASPNLGVIKIPSKEQDPNGCHNIEKDFRKNF